MLFVVLHFINGGNIMKTSLVSRVVEASRDTMGRKAMLKVCYIFLFFWGGGCSPMHNTCSAKVVIMVVKLNVLFGV